MLSILLVGLALVPASVALANEPRQTAQPADSVVARSLAWIAALGLAGGYQCAIVGLKVWAKLRPPRSAD